MSGEVQYGAFCTWEAPPDEEEFTLLPETPSVIQCGQGDQEIIGSIFV